MFSACVRAFTIEDWSILQLLEVNARDKLRYGGSVAQVKSYSHSDLFENGTLTLYPQQEAPQDFRM